MRAGDIPRPDQRRADQVRFSTAVRGRTTIIPSTDGDFRLPVMLVIVRLAPRNALPFRQRTATRASMNVYSSKSTGFAEFPQ